jgi:hypothetical protein
MPGGDKASGGDKAKEPAAPSTTSEDAGAGPSSSSSSAAAAPQTAVVPTTPAEKAALLERIKAQLAGLGIRQAAASASERQTREAKARYAFWETQPVVQFGGGAAAEPSATAAAGNGAPAASAEGEEEDGPIDAPKTVADVKKEPYALAPG